MNTPTPNGPSAEQINELVSLFEAGLPLRLAANAIGATEATLKAWVERDAKLEILLGGAEASFQMRCINAILSARDKNGNANVRAMIWLLESCFPEQYGRKTKSRSKSLSNPQTAAAARVPEHN